MQSFQSYCCLNCSFHESGKCIQYFGKKINFSKPCGIYKDYLKKDSKRFSKEFKSLYKKAEQLKKKLKLKKRAIKVNDGKSFVDLRNHYIKGIILRTERGIPVDVNNVRLFHNTLLEIQGRLKNKEKLRVERILSEKIEFFKKRYEKGMNSFLEGC